MNGLKTFLLLTILTGIFLAFGYYFGGEGGMIIALVFAVITNFWVYFFSDKLVLKMYRAKPIAESDPIYGMVRNLAGRAGLPMPGVYMIDLPVPNAFATGRNPSHSAVAVSQSLIDILNRDELEGVLAHELSHIKNRDTLVSTIAASLAGALSAIAQMAMFTGGGNSERSGGNMISALVLLILAPLIGSLIHMAVSRAREFGADETGAKICGNPRALATALQKIHEVGRRHPLKAQPKHEVTAHLFIANPFRSDFFAKLFSTHPPVDERVERLKKM